MEQGTVRYGLQLLDHSFPCLLRLALDALDGDDLENRLDSRRALGQGLFKIGQGFCRILFRPGD